MSRRPSTLFINSRSSIRAFTLEKAKGMGLETILVKNRLDRMREVEEISGVKAGKILL